MENVLAQELVANGFSLFYFDKAKIGEVDFVLQRGSAVLPLEAKSGTDFKSHRALDNLMRIDEWGVEQAVVLCGGNVSSGEGITYLPWYAVSFIEQEKLPESLVVRF